MLFRKNKSGQMRKSLVTGASWSGNPYFSSPINENLSTVVVPGSALFSLFHAQRMKQVISSSKYLVTVSVQLIVNNGSHYVCRTYYVSDTVLKCILPLLTSNPYYNPIWKMGTILICVFEDSVHLESSRAMPETQEVLLYSPYSYLLCYIAPKLQHD